MKIIKLTTVDNKIIYVNFDLIAFFFEFKGFTKLVRDNNTFDFVKETLEKIIELLK